MFDMNSFRSCVEKSFSKGLDKEKYGKAIEGIRNIASQQLDKEVTVIDKAKSHNKIDDFER